MSSKYPGALEHQFCNVFQRKKQTKNFEKSGKTVTKLYYTK
jgi:hypothetical protein